MTEETTDDGVRVVGATTPDDEEATGAEPGTRGPKRRPGGASGVPSRRAFRLVSVAGRDRARRHPGLRRPLHDEEQ